VKNGRPRFEFCRTCGSSHLAGSCPSTALPQTPRLGRHAVTREEALREASSNPAHERRIAELLAKAQQRQAARSAKPAVARLIKLSHLRIESARATRVDGSGRCDSCRGLYAPLWRHSQTNFGVVYLCSPCHAEAVSHRSSPSATDAWHLRYRQ
jgi:hypothetical protein